jgi:Gamma-glutamyl cyclotransferase, AIG2-like
MTAADMTDEENTLFVYGSLLDRSRQLNILGRPVNAIPATIPDYERGRARYFFIQRRPGLSTAGLLLLNLTPADFGLLDAYEEIPRLYTRQKVAVFDEAGHRLRCWAYLPTAFTLAGHT